MVFDLRFATHDDTGVIADFVIAAGDGIFEQLFQDLAPGLATADLVAMAVACSGTGLSYANALLAEEDGRVCGLALAYPAADFGLPAIAEAMMPRKRLEPLREMLTSRIEGSYYLNSLAVAPEYRGRGLGRLLLQTTAQIARESGRNILSLHARADNLPAMRLYQSAGFSVVRLIAIPATAYLERARAMALMRASLPLRSASAAANSPAHADHLIDAGPNASGELPGK